ncbi:MAG: xylan 1,4-beta-xylosidase, partial [Candidatus Limnocylindrales bacterium]
MTSGSSARIAWFATGGAQSPRDRPTPPVALPPPAGVAAVRGRGQVTVDWSPVDGAIGYLVHRAPAESVLFAPIDQHTGDVLAVPHGPYLDTTGPCGEDAWYAVSSV